MKKDDCTQATLEILWLVDVMSIYIEGGAIIQMNCLCGPPRCFNAIYLLNLYRIIYCIFGGSGEAVKEISYANELDVSFMTKPCKEVRSGLAL